MPDNAELRHVKTFPSLVKYLRDRLNWPIETEDFDDLTFDYEAEELGIDQKNAAKIQEIKQLRPLVTNQPWGIFFVKFEPKRLPVVALRRILGQLVIKKRASAKKADIAAWQPHDLLFISAYGEGEQRQINLAHFSERNHLGDLPTLKVLGWDGDDTKLKLHHVAHELQTKLCWPEDESNISGWRQQWAAAFTLGHREVITTSQRLAVRLADLAANIRRKVNAALAVETDKGPLRKLMLAFQEALIHDLQEDDFADMYAQTIAYGLLSARVARQSGALVADDVALMVPVTNPFLRELMETFLKVGGRNKHGPNGAHIDFDELGINEVVELLREANMEAVLRDFDNLNPQEDPVIHFYELFLKEYDAKKRMQRGVFYTPKPVVSYIVRSVHELLQTEFGLQHGLADNTTWGEMCHCHPEIKIPDGTSPEQPFVQIVDPATGTATFLVEVIDVIHRDLKSKWDDSGADAVPRIANQESQIRDFVAYWNEYVPRYLLPRLQGYELMMAPYAIAHMKIGLKLAETGYRFQSVERVRVYLTNALEPWAKQLRLPDIDALAHEAAAVNEIKRHERFTVVIGNPPYAGHSANVGEWIQELLRSNLSDGTQGYFVVDGASLDERNPKWLNDDYVKFIRFGQRAISESRGGILGFVTNHSYSDNPTFRGMRQSLIQTFDRVLVVDLHGNVKKAATTEVDQNVFDIQQGVAIGLWRRSLLPRTKSSINRAEVWGDRSTKYNYLLKHSALNTPAIEIGPVSPFYLFVTQAADLRQEFLAGWSVSDIFPVNTMGVTTGRDQLCVSFTDKDALAKLTEFTSNLPETELAARFGLSNKSGWNIANARKAMRTKGVSASRCQLFGYRPLDQRVLYLDTAIVGRGRLEVMKNMIGANNLAICTTRQVNGEFRHVFCSRVPTNDCVVSNASGERAYLFPLYLAPDHRGLISHHEWTPNLAAGFVSSITHCLRLQLREITPEDIIHYLYAILHSLDYRNRYGEFFRIDFPRLPLTGNLELFRALARLGGELVALHLMESPKLGKHLTKFIGSGTAQIEKVSYSNETVWIDKAKTQGFRIVPENVWQFHIGGYQVCEKWLKDRGPKKGNPGRVLTADDINHYYRIVVALHETIRLMTEIDKVIDQHGGWPGAFVTEPIEADETESPAPFA